MIRAAKGEWPIEMKKSVVQDIRANFKDCLRNVHYGDDIMGASYKEMFDILDPTMPTERIKYRVRAGNDLEARRDFVALQNIT